ncbi:hypothetical protein [Lysobacter sp. ESA13C]|uniref:hypothetical protein n=1 Tax=Lysobacter sp. ESA13C TaxID=2862676 RepID=UPI001CBD6144|nr:hypothetical protein [Lysobacter sp. ESA13C]
MKNESMDRRYLKRMEAYWARVERRRRSFDWITDNDFFDFWHTHIDWRGRGNRSLPDRMRVAELTYRLLLDLNAFARSRSFPVQCWATLCEDTGSNAVYLHSANPNGVPFPYEFDRAEWDVEPPLEAASITPTQPYRIGRIRYQDSTTHIIQLRD